MLARIYQPAKNAMQSGRAKTGYWALEFESEVPRNTEPLMGWTSGADTRASELHLEFDSKEAAIAYAEKHGYPYQVFEARPAAPVAKSYSDNFAFRRRKPWTH